MLICAAVFAASGFATPASAQATRTWVSGVGDDANPCSRTAPCKTFAGAISKTAAGGEINCLDPAGFGGVTITKSLSIVCDFTEGGILSAGAGVNGIIVNAGANDTIFLSGLDLNGAGNAQNGIRIIAGGAVHIQNSVIRNYRAANGLGISFQPSGATRLYVRDSVIADNGSGGSGGGVLIQPTGAGSARAEFTNVFLSNNANDALRINSTGNSNSGGNSVIFRGGHISGSTTGVNVISPSGSNPSSLLIVDSEIYNNPAAAFIANGALAQIFASNNNITGNGQVTVFAAGGVIQSFGDNRTIANSAGATFTPPNQTRN
jgi:hypothetical protein